MRNGWHTLTPRSSVLVKDGAPTKLRLTPPAPSRDLQHGDIAFERAAKAAGRALWRAFPGYQVSLMGFSDPVDGYGTVVANILHAKRPDKKMPRVLSRSKKRDDYGKKVGRW